jgi:predicted acylesterase/phospholipase RssA
MTADPSDQGGPPLLDPAQEPPLDRYCDVVMKGGVTDGVVYPWAVMELARHYRFQSIGGTSVGAVAAALTAASEYSRRYGSVNGFNQVLREVPLALAEQPDGVNTKLFSLFHPSPGGERLFRLFVGVFGKKKGWPGARAVIQQVLADYLLQPNLRRRQDRGIVLLLIAGLGLMLAAALRQPAWVVLLALATASLGALMLVAWRLMRDVRSQLGGPGNGLCTGMGPSHGPDGFTDWLHQGIQAASGRPLDMPLTFRDLWDAPCGPDLDQHRSGLVERPQSIALQMMSTNLTHGRACGLPLNDNSEQLYFLEADLAPYFPASVLRYLCAHCPVLPGHGPLALRELPKGELPVLVAARLSLSFPLLFKAVPLWTIPGNGAPYRCWFSDGGICANFPIHLFDAVLPRWPTFGITLVDTGRTCQAVDDVWINPASYVPRELHHPASQAQPEPPSIGRLRQFLVSILSAARLWNDNATARLPGVRERVVNIYPGPNRSRGGLNLTMAPEDLLAMATLGRRAGQALVAKYITAAPGTTAGTRPSTAWDSHRWVRFNTFVKAMQAKMEGFTQSARHAPHSQPLGGLINAFDPSLSAAPDACQLALTATQAQALCNAELALTQLEASLEESGVVQPFDLRPQPELRLRATL